MLELVGKSIMKKKKKVSVIVSRYLHQNTYNYKGDKGNFAMDKSDRHHRIQGVKLPISRNEMYGHHIPPGVMCREDNIPSGGFPGGPVVKTPHSQWRGHGFSSWSGK